MGESWTLLLSWFLFISEVEHFICFKHLNIILCHLSINFTFNQLLEKWPQRGRVHTVDSQSHGGYVLQGYSEH